jgi:hypothetical protein
MKRHFGIQGTTKPKERVNETTSKQQQSDTVPKFGF